MDPLLLIVWRLILLRYKGPISKNSKYLGKHYTVCVKERGLRSQKY